MRLTNVKALLITTALFIALLIASCAKPSQETPSTPQQPGLSGSIKVIGSNTVTPISSVWAENFMKANPKVSIAVSGPGSGVGIAALIDGTTDICQASRAMKSSEIDQAKAKGHNPYEIKVAYDGLAIVVNPANKVNELTMEQLSDIYAGKVSNWKDVGGANAPIVVISRDSNSGTHVFFKEHIVQLKDKKAEYGQNALFLPSTEAGITETAGNVNAIFYAGLGYISKDVKILGIKKDASSAVVTPRIATVHDNSYPVARPLFFYTDGVPQGVIKAFVDYGLSQEGQAAVEKMGFVPLPR